MHAANIFKSLSHLKSVNQITKRSIRKTQKETLYGKQTKSINFYDIAAINKRTLPIVQYASIAVLRENVIKLCPIKT